MKLLFLTPQIPYPPTQGAALRNYNILRGVSQMHDVSLLTFAGENQDRSPERLAPLFEICRHIKFVTAPKRPTFNRISDIFTTREPDMGLRLKSKEFEQALLQLLENEQFDIVQVEGIELARYIKVIQAFDKQIKIVFDDHNAETALQKSVRERDSRRPSKWLGAIYSSIQVTRLERFETQICRQVDCVTVVSEKDKEEISKLAPQQKIVAIPNSIDVDLYKTVPAEEMPAFDILFSGTMDYRPNVDGIEWFFQLVWPKIRENLPSTTIKIAGQKVHPGLHKYKELEGVQFTGFVDSIIPYIHATKVVILPLHMGSGTRLKFIQALAVGKAVVTTTIGAEGFPVSDGNELFFADSPGDFASAVVTLLTNEQKRLDLAAQGQLFVEAYDWRRIVPKFNEVYESLV